MTGAFRFEVGMAAEVYHSVAVPQKCNRIFFANVFDCARMASTIRKFDWLVVIPDTSHPETPAKRVQIRQYGLPPCLSQFGILSVTN